MTRVDSYRRDSRTVEQFAADIEHGSKVERELIERYARYYERKYGIRLEIEDNGCDNSGGLLDEEDVTTRADFKIGCRPVEVKFNNHFLDFFRLKASQLDSYLQQEAWILWVNGYETERPLFMILSAAELEQIKVSGRVIPFAGWGGKLCYVLQADDYNWYELGA